MHEAKTISDFKSCVFQFSIYVRLSFEGKWLSNETTKLQDLRASQDNKPVELTYQVVWSGQIFVKTLSGKTLSGCRIS